MDNDTPEVIEAQMAETRQSLTEKVAALEDSVVGTVQSATTAVQDTVQSVRDAVEDTVGTVKENVSSALDVSRHVRDNPWMMVGGAAAAGFLAGFTLSRKGSAPSATASTTRMNVPAAAPVKASSPGVVDALLCQIGDELKKLGESAIQSVSANLQRAVNDGLPKLVDRLVEPSKKGEEDANTYPIGRWNGTAVAGGR